MQEQERATVVHIFRVGDGFGILPTVVAVRFPAGRFATATEAAACLFDPKPDATEMDQLFPLNAYGVPLPRPNGTCYDVSAFDMGAPDHTFAVEITKDWARFYLSPPKRAAMTREELEGQDVTCRHIVDRAVELTGGEIITR